MKKSIKESNIRNRCKHYLREINKISVKKSIQLEQEKSEMKKTERKEKDCERNMEVNISRGEQKEKENKKIKKWKEKKEKKRVPLKVYKCLLFWHTSLRLLTILAVLKQFFTFGF